MGDSETSQSGSGATPQPIDLIPNVNINKSHGWMHWLIDGIIVCVVIVVITVATDGAGDGAIIADGIGDAADADEGLAPLAEDTDGEELGDADQDVDDIGNNDDDDSSDHSSSAGGSFSSNQGGTFFMINDGEVYEYYISGQELLIPQAYPQEIISAITSQYDIIGA